MSNQAKHTPGPWHVNAIDSRRTRVVGDETAPIGTWDKLQVNNRNCTIATVYRPADARLIASAPETAAERDALRAENAELRAALEIFLAWVDSGNDGLPDEHLLSIAVIKARAALAKVTP